MNVTEALEKRISVRAFQDIPVSEADIREILRVASRAPSGGNLQPWKVHVVIGDARKRFLDTIDACFATSALGEQPQISVYPPKLGEPYRTRRFEVGNEMYEKLGIPREDKAARLTWFRNNFRFFGAPAGLFFSIDKQFDRGQWAHLGMFMQSIALAAHERGFGTCMQECWSICVETISEFLNLNDDEQFYCGMALGVPDTAAPVNQLRTSRAEIHDFTTFIKE